MVYGENGEKATARTLEAARPPLHLTTLSRAKIGGSAVSDGVFRPMLSR